MSIISSALGGAAGIFGAVKAGQAMNAIRKNLKQQQAENQAWYNQRYNEDATQRADAQRILTMTEEAIKNRNRQSAATAAVMGGTEESVAAAKAANAQAMSDAAAQIAIAGDKRKDTIESQYQQRNAELNSQLNELNLKKAQNAASAAQVASDAFGNIY